MFCGGDSKKEVDGILLKLVDSSHVIGFDERAILARTCEFVAAGCDVVVARAVRSCRELLKELQIRQRGGINSCCVQVVSQECLGAYALKLCRRRTSLLKWSC